MKTSRIFAFCTLLALSGAQVACGDPPVHAPTTDGKLFRGAEKAFRTETTGTSAEAETAWLDALDQVAESDGDVWQVPVALAALDALVYRNVSALPGKSALAFRVKNGTTEARLLAISKKAKGPFLPGLVARARIEIAEVRGNAEGATVLRRESGCAERATVLGPSRFARLADLKKPTLLERAEALLPESVTSPGPYGRTERAETLIGSGCRLDLGQASWQSGMREVVVDVDVPASGRVGLMLVTKSPAVLRAGGAEVLTRELSVGAGASTHLAEVAATPGKLRLVVRVGQSSSQDALELYAWDQNGRPLASSAPKPGDAGTSKVTKAVLVAAPAVPKSPGHEAEELVAGLVELATRHDRAAEERMQSAQARFPKDPSFALVYARAVRSATDLEPVHISERAQRAYELVLEKSATSWEAAIELAELAGERRGEGEARIFSLRELDKRAEAMKTRPDTLLAYEAITAGRAELYDRARRVREATRATLDGTLLGETVDREVVPRRGPDALAFECDKGPTRDHTSMRCYVEKRLVGDAAGAEAELVRLRGLFGAPRFFLSGSLRDALGRGASAEAKKLYDALPESEKSVSFFNAVDPRASMEAVITRALRANDAPGSLPAVFAAKGKEMLAEFEGVAEKVTEADRKSPAMPSAATAILAHEERYSVSNDGLVSFVLYDVRRLGGTADVESHAQASGPSVGGRSVSRILRRRIFKKDGRILTPDQTPRASQAHADLSQLEAGDAVEAVYAGYSLPNDRGDVSFDTPDLLPERTAVASAKLEIRLPAGKPGAMWAHPLLGKPVEKRDGGTRVLTYTVENRGARRFEDGTPKMDRSCGVSFSTARWSDLATSLSETLTSLDDRGSPEVAAWIREVSTKDGKKLEGRALVDAVVAASGVALKVSSPSTLSDYELGRTDSVTTQTARTMLSRHEGSRTWLVVRALRELGIPTDVIVAEDGPFSADPAFPPHLGRFTHPLALVHLEGKDAAGKPTKEDIVVDADVQGPPLPAGRVSPELRGRSALYPTGAIAPLPKVDTQAERDEVDLRLTLDEAGNAKGSLTVLVRGRPAQQLAETFVRVVGTERQRALQSIALAWVPFASVDKVELSSREGSWEVAIRADLTVGSYAQVESGGTWALPGLDPVHIVYPRPYVSTLGNLYVAQSGREGAFAVDRAVQYHVRRRVELPKGAKVQRQPGPFEVRSPELDSQRLMRVDGQIIEEDFVLGLPTGTITQQHYAAFAADARKTDDAFLASFRIAPPSKPAGTPAPEKKTPAPEKKTPAPEKKK